MKKWTKLFVLLIAVALLAVCAISVSAASTVTSGGFRYVSGGTEYTTTSMTFGEVVAAADAGSTVTMLGDYREESSINGYIATVNKKLTLDMGGYTFTIAAKYEDATNYGQPRIAVSTSAGFTVKNGTAVAGFTTSGQKTRAYPFFQFTANNAVLNLEDVNFYGGALYYTWGNRGVAVNVTGGEHHSIYAGYGCDGGFLDSRAGVTINMTDARIYLSNNSWLVSSLHQNDGSSAPVSTITFDGCDILTESASINLVKYASEYTSIRFDECNIFGGTIAPTVTTGEANKGIGSAKAGSIVFGVGTKWHKDLTYDATVAFSEEGLLAIRESSTSVAYSFSSGNLSDGFSIAASSTAAYPTYYALVSEADGELVSVSWYDEDGTLITTTEEIQGVSITPPTLDSYREENNGWYTQVYDGWATDMGGEAESLLFATEPTSFYLTRGTVKEGMSVSKYNLTLMGHVQINLYIPMGMPAGVTVKGVYVGEENARLERGALPFGEITEISKEKYFNFVIGYAGAAHLEAAHDVYIKYEVRVGDSVTTLTKNVQLSAL